MDLVLITTYIERRQDDELCRLAEELKEAKIKKSEILRTCLALGLDAVRELVPEVLAELKGGGGMKSDSPSPLKMGMYYQLPPQNRDRECVIKQYRRHKWKVI